MDQSNDPTKNAKKLSLDGFEEVVPEAQSPWSESAQYRAIKTALAGGALAQLSPAQRQAFELVVLRGETEETAATVMRCTRSSVRTHIRRAGERLKKIIETQMSPMPDEVQINNQRVKPAPLSDNAWSDEG